MQSWDAVAAVGSQRARAGAPFPDPVHEFQHRIPRGRAGGRADCEVPQQAVVIPVRAWPRKVSRASLPCPLRSRRASGVRGAGMGLIAPTLPPEVHGRIAQIVVRRRRRSLLGRKPLRLAATSIRVSVHSCASTLPDALARPPETAPVLIPSDEPVQLRVFVDRSVVEVFVNERLCVAVRIYPGRRDSRGVPLMSRGQESELLSLDCWQMKSIYE